MQTITQIRLAKLLATCFSLLIFLPLSSSQRLQVQLSYGANFSEAHFEKNNLAESETAPVVYDSIGNTQLGLGLNIRLHKNIHLRLDANYKIFQTGYTTNTSDLNLGRFTQGSLLKENLVLSLMPEYRLWPKTSGKFAFPLYLFGGGLLSLERKNNYYEYTTLQNLVLTEHSGEAKPDAAFGWCLGFGLNPKWDRFGLLLEMRYSRMAAVSELVVVPKMSFEHFSLMAGLTVDLWK